MKILSSKISTKDKDYQTNAASMQQLVNTFHEHTAILQKGSSDQAKQRQHDKGKLLVRERIDTIIDTNSDFLEIGLFAGNEMYDDYIPAGGVVTGIGMIEQTPCMITANDPTVKGGSYFPITVKKHLRAQAIAQAMRLPCVYLVDSGGAFLPKQDEVFPDKEDFGRIFFNQARLSADNIPQISVVMGSCTAGGAYIPAMADISIIVKQQGTIFLGGPPLVKAATGEVVSAENLGGADVHCRQSGVADYYADNDEQALSLARMCVRNLNLPPLTHQPTSTPPLHPEEELLGLIPTDPRMPIEMREIIARLVDASEFDEFKQLFGTTLICGFARIDNHLIGIVANNGILFSDSALKGTQFIQLCNKRKIPLLFLQNTNGFMVGKASESEGIAKHGAKMVTAVACSEVPKFTIIVGGSYGAGNYAMCGRAYDPMLLLSWPNARISVMGGEQAANVLADVKQAQCERQGQQWNPQHRDRFMQSIREQYQQQGNAWYASARLWDDGMIDPCDTRRVLSIALSIVSQHPIKETNYGIFRM
ncbi:MAG: methylcrotonoyl-CoA carboxylase [Legionellales bacterium]|nr:methylcrotonoyl-CoA carboxylase [Legionellales bacterium]